MDFKTLYARYLRERDYIDANFGYYLGFEEFLFMLIFEEVRVR